MNKTVRGLLTALVVLIAAAGAALKYWQYISNPWTRDGQVRAQVIQITPRVTAPLIELSVKDNQLGANVVLNAITTVVPQTRLISVLVGRAADVAPMVGNASMEAEATDSVTGTRLAAAVDRRVGAKTLRGAFSTWGDVEAAFDTWAESFSKRIAALRAGQK